MRSAHFLPRARLVHVTDPALAYASGKSVLHVGMGGNVEDDDTTDRELAADAVPLHCELARVAASLTGIDINPYAIEVMRRSVPGRYIVADITKTLPDDLAAQRFEVIVFGDVIEHLDNFGVALRNLAGLLTEDGVIVISTVNAYCFDAFLKMVFRYESVHDEHTCYFSYMTLKRSLAINGLAMIEFMFYTHKRRGAGLGKFNSATHFITHHVGNFVATICPQFAKGIVAVARPAPQAPAPPSG